MLRLRLIPLSSVVVGCAVSVLSASVALAAKASDAATTPGPEMSVPKSMSDRLVGLRTQLLEVAAGAVKGEKRFDIHSQDFNFHGLNPVPEVLVNLYREIEKNPNSTSESDLFLVKDHFELGVRSGVAYGPYADVIVRSSWELAYPARSKAEAQMNNGFIVNLLLPAAQRLGQLPPSYVLKNEYSIGLESGVEGENYSAPITPKIQIGTSEIRLWRSIYDHRDAHRAVFYRERQKFIQPELDLYAKYGPLQIPVLKVFKQWGTADGKGLTLSEAELNDPKIESALQHALVDGRFDELPAHEVAFSSIDSLSQLSKTWNLVVFHSLSRVRFDRVQVQASREKNVVEVKSSSESKLALLSFVNAKKISVELYADPNSAREIELHVNVIGSDAHTSDAEMAHKYLRFVNGLSIGASTTGQPLATLTQTAGSGAKGWGAVSFESETTYSPLATSKLLAASDDQIWNALATSMRVSRRQLDAIRAGDGDEAQIENVARAQSLLKAVARAKTESRLDEKLKILADAVRRVIYIDKAGFYNPTLLGAINQLVGLSNLDSRTLISVSDAAKESALEPTPLLVRFGQPVKSGLKYLIYEPISAIDLYTMFDTWF